MAGRVNTKFVFLLTAVIVGFVVGIAGFWYMFVRQSAESLILQGDTYRQQGEYYLAIENYEKAISKRRDDVDLLEKYVGFIETLPAQNQLDAQDFLGKRQEALRLISELRPNDEPALARYYQMLLDVARDLNAPGYYSRVFELATVRVQSYPRNMVARKYRGISMVNILTPDMAAQDINQALLDLEMALEQQPDDTDVIYHIARWHLFEAKRLDRPEGRPDKAVLLRAQALEMCANMLANQPDDPDLMFKYMQILLDPRLVSKKSDDTSAQEQRAERISQASTIADRLESRLQENPLPQHQVLMLANILKIVDREIVQQGDNLPLTTTGIQRSGKVLETALATEPTNIAYNYALARIRLQQGHTDKAREAFEATQTISAAKPIQMIQAQRLQMAASYEIGKLTLAQSQAAQTEEERNTLLAQVIQIADQINAVAGENIYVHSLRGRIAMINKDFLTADQHFDKASGMAGEVDLEMILLSSRVRKLRGAWGAALKRLAQALTVIAQTTQNQIQQNSIRLEMVEIYLNHKNTQPAELHLAKVLETQPKNRRALLLYASLCTQQNKTDEALAVYEQFDLDKIPQVRGPLASLYHQKGETDKARELLQVLFDRNPSNINMLRAMLQLTEDPQQKEILLDTARNAGVDPQVVEQLAQGKNPSGMTVPEAIAKIESTDQSPLQKALSKCHIYQLTGDVENMAAAIEEAAAIDADHPQVIERQFNLALSKSDWDNAAKLAERAGRKNLDKANGEFYRARLSASQGDLSRSASAYHRGLALDPTLSLGWRQLGYVLALDRKWNQAIEAYEHAVEIKPDNVAALRGLAAAQEAMDQPQSALDNMRKAYHYKPNNQNLAEAYLQTESRYGQKQKVLELRAQIAARNPKNIINRRRLVLILAEAGQAELAITTANDLITDNGNTRENIAVLAEAHRLLDDIAQGTKVIKQYLEARGAMVDAIDQALLARYLLRAGDSQGALQAYRDAIALEDSQQRPISRELADLLFERGVFDRALTLYSSLHEQWPDDQNVALRLAEVYLRLEKFDEAESILNQLREKQGEQEPGAGLLALKALIAHHRGDLEEARQLFIQAIRKRPTQPSLYYQRALVLSELGRDEQAEVDLNQALSLKANHVLSRITLAQLYVRQDKTGEAIRELRTLLSLTPTFRPAIRNLLKLHLQEEDLTAANQLLLDALEAFPDDVGFIQQMAGLAQRSGDFAKALALRQRAFDLDPSANNLVALATSLLSAERIDEVDALLDGNLDMVNQTPILLAIRCRVMATQGQSQKARQGFIYSLEHCTAIGEFDVVVAHILKTMQQDETLALLTENQETINPIWVQLTMARFQLQSRQPAQAIDTLRAIESSIPTELHQRLNSILAASLYQTGQFAQATEKYQELLQGAPNNVQFLNNLAYMLAEDLNQATQALPYAQKAAKLMPTSAQILDTLGWIQYRVGNLTDALDTLNRSIQLASLAPNHLHRGVVYEELDNLNRAREDYMHAIELAEKFDDAEIKAQATRRLKSLALAVKE